MSRPTSGLRKKLRAGFRVRPRAYTRRFYAWIHAKRARGSISKNPYRGSLACVERLGIMMYIIRNIVSVERPRSYVTAKSNVRIFSRRCSVLAEDEEELRIAYGKFLSVACVMRFRF